MFTSPRIQVRCNACTPLVPHPGPTYSSRFFPGFARGVSIAQLRDFQDQEPLCGAVTV